MTRCLWPGFTFGPRQNGRAAWLAAARLVTRLAVWLVILALMLPVVWLVLITMAAAL